MMTAIIVAVWLACGFIGSAFVWLADAIEWKKPKCPAPRHIFLWLIGSLGGLSMLLAGAILLVFHAAAANPNPNSWWNRPICRRRPHAR